MKSKKEINEDEIRILGERVKSRKRKWLTLAFFLVVIAIVAAVIILIVSRRQTSQITEEPALFEPINETPSPAEVEPLAEDSTVLSHTFIMDTTINDIPLRIYIPKNAEATLQLDKLDNRDTTIILGLQAADIRADNHKILGAFVMKGTPLAWGKQSKRGYCAIIENNITVGVSENTPLFEEATEKEGYFFRQYPLVDWGILVENEPKNKSLRRALCSRAGEIFVIVSLTNESFHDFAQALVDLSVENAIYLVGGESSLGFAVDAAGKYHFLGPESIRRGAANTSFIVWRRR